MTAPEATPELDPPRHDRAFLGHPKGLGYLALVEGCERFSYYSMQTLLVLYMVKHLLLPEHIGGVLGLGWLRDNYYTGLVSLALFSRLAPRAINATVLGIYYLAFFAANKIVGTVGGWYSSMDTARFWLIHVATAVVGLVAFALFKWVLAPRLLREEA